MDNLEIVELIEIPFFNHFYMDIFSNTDTQMDYHLKVPYRYVVMILPKREEIGILRFASEDKFFRLKSTLDVVGSLALVKLHRKSGQAYISGGDAETLNLPQKYRSPYLYSRNIWLSSERLAYSISPGNNKIVFNISSSSKNMIIFSSKSTSAEKYGLSLCVTPVKMTKQFMNDAISFHPNNYGTSAPRFFSVPCTAFRLNSRGEVQEVSLWVAFSEARFKYYQKKLVDGLYLAELIIVSGRTFGELIESDYNIIINLTPMDPYLLVSYFGNSGNLQTTFIVERIMRKMVKEQLEKAIGTQLLNKILGSPAPLGFIKMESSEGSTRLMSLRLSVVTRMIEMYLLNYNRTFFEKLFDSQDLINSFEKLISEFKENRHYLSSGELISPTFRSMLTEFI